VQIHFFCVTQVVGNLRAGFALPGKRPVLLPKVALPRGEDQEKF
jgi:hypothetical protein